MVTYLMLEILVGVARMPIEYRIIRRNTLIADYERHLTCHQALEAFNCLIQRTKPNQLSEKGQACYKATIRLAGKEHTPTGT